MLLLIMEIAIKKYKGVIFIQKNQCIKSVSVDNEQVKITVQKLPDRPGIAGELFTKLAENNINIDLIIQNLRHSESYNDLTFTINKKYLIDNNRILPRITSKLGAQNAEVDTTVSKITVNGEGMIKTPGVAAAVFKSLGNANINIQLIATSEEQICCLIDERDSDLAVETIERQFKTD